MPGLTLPVSRTCAPSAKRRGIPNRCRRAISSAASTGNICARRASSVGEFDSLMRLGCVAAEFAQRASLAQEIPVAVELALDLGQALLLLIARLAVLEEAVLLGDERLDVGENGCILFGLGHINLLCCAGRPRT